MSPSIWQLLIVLAIVLLLFGGKRLANLGGDLGTAIKGFKKSMHDEEQDDKDKQDEDASSPGRLHGSEKEDADFDRETESRETDRQR